MEYAVYCEGLHVPGGKRIPLYRSFFDSGYSTNLRSGDEKKISIFILISRIWAVSEWKEIMSVSAWYKRRGVSYRREEDEAVEFASGHTHPPSESRQDSEFIIEASTSEHFVPAND